MVPWAFDEEPGNQVNGRNAWHVARTHINATEIKTAARVMRKRRDDFYQRQTCVRADTRHQSVLRSELSSLLLCLAHTTSCMHVRQVPCNISCGMAQTRVERQDI